MISWIAVQADFIDTIYRLLLKLNDFAVVNVSSFLFTRRFFSCSGLFPAKLVTSLRQPDNFFFNLINYPIKNKGIHAVRSTPGD